MRFRIYNKFAIIMYMSITRTKCVICNGNYRHIYAMKNTPISFCPRKIDQNDDRFVDLIFCGCDQCGSVQLVNLIDPIILYDGSHNMTYLTPTWKEHHLKLSKFILDNCTTDHITEVGGGNGILAKHILQQITISYTIVDLCNMQDSILNIDYRQGNCEDYIFPNNDCVIMSHVFEHLYNPMKFINNLKLCGVTKVVISIPNMMKQIESEYLSVIHIEHTYLVDDNDTEWMFSQYGYKLIKKEYFGIHSIFLVFEFVHNLQPLQMIIRPERMNFVKDYLIKREQKLSQIIIPSNSFIVPGGHYGQLIYMHLQHDNAVLGFLDNDKSKHGLRMYGTRLLTYPIEEVSKYNDISIILHGGPYTKEIQQSILNYNKNACIIII